MPEKKNEKNRTTLIIVAAVAVVALIVIGIVNLPSLNKPEKVTQNMGIGTIRTEPIFVQSMELQYVFTDMALPSEEFREAGEKIEKVVKKCEDEFSSMMKSKNLNINNDADAKVIDAEYAKIRQKLEKETSAVIYPLKKKAEAAIAQIAVEKNMAVVLDKSIVVCGTEDITDLVLEKMKQPEVTMPEEGKLKDLALKSKIGYFNKNVVLSLPKFQDVEKQLMEFRAQVSKDFDERSRNLNDEQKVQLIIMYDNEIKKTSANLYAPLYREVNRTVTEVAEKNNIDLVVDMENIMYGGRNLTDEVADSMMGKKSANGSSESGADK